MIFYNTFHGLIVIHFLIGLGLTFAYAFHCVHQGHIRHLFTFGGKWDSVGTREAWLKWYIAAYIFEALTSFLPGTGNLYGELAMSIFEAGAFCGAAFIVDRFALLFEVFDERVETHRSGHSDSTGRGDDTVVDKPQQTPGAYAEERKDSQERRH